MILDLYLDGMKPNEDEKITRERESLTNCWLHVYLKNIKNRSVSLRERSSLLLLFVIFVVIFAYTGKKGKRHEERNLMMSLTVRRTKNNVFVTTTARNNDKRVSIVCSLSFLSRSFSLSVPLSSSLSLSVSLSSNRCENRTCIHLHFLSSSFILH